MAFAQEEARTLSCNYVDTEPILLGLLREQTGSAAAVLTSLGITEGRVRGRMARIVGSSAAGVSEQIPFTGRLDKVLQRAQRREAHNLGHNHVDTGHILLALVVEQNEGAAARICSNSASTQRRFATA